MGTQSSLISQVLMLALMGSPLRHSGGGSSQRWRKRGKIHFLLLITHTPLPEPHLPPTSPQLSLDTDFHRLNPVPSLSRHVALEQQVQAARKKLAEFNPKCPWTLSPL